MRGEDSKFEDEAVLCECDCEWEWEWEYERV